MIEIDPLGHVAVPNDAPGPEAAQKEKAMSFGSMVLAHLIGDVEQYASMV